VLDKCVGGRVLSALEETHSTEEELSDRALKAPGPIWTKNALIGKGLRKRWGHCMGEKPPSLQKLCPFKCISSRKSSVWGGRERRFVLKRETGGALLLEKWSCLIRETKRKNYGHSWEPKICWLPEMKRDHGGKESIKNKRKSTA